MCKGRVTVNKQLFLALYFSLPITLLGPMFNEYMVVVGGILMCMCACE